MNRPKFQYSLTFRRKFNLFEVYESPTTQSQFNFPQPGQQPALSILVVQRNGLRYLAETLATISAQKFKDYELIVVDGASTDGSVEFLKSIKNIKLITEEDNGMDEGFCKGLKLATGKYITHCCVSDGYLDESWLQKAIDKLETDSDLSLVWAFPRTLDPNDILKEVCYPEFHLMRPLSKVKFYQYWLYKGLNFPEGNYVVDINVMKKCFPSRLHPGIKYAELEYDPWLQFVANFHCAGYLSASILSVANYGRVHADSVTLADEKNNKLKILMENYNQYRHSEIAFLSTRGHVKIFYNRFGNEVRKLKKYDHISNQILIKLLLVLVRCMRLIGKTLGSL